MSRFSTPIQIIDMGNPKIQDKLYWRARTLGIDYVSR